MERPSECHELTGHWWVKPNYGRRSFTVIDECGVTVAQVYSEARANAISRLPDVVELMELLRGERPADLLQKIRGAT